MLSCDSPSQKTTTSGGSSLTCKIPCYRGSVQLKRICQSLQLSAKVPHEPNTQMPSMVIIFLEKGQNQLISGWKYQLFTKKISWLPVPEMQPMKRRYPKWRQTRLTKKEKKKYIQEEIILCVLCNPLEFECDAVVKNPKKRPKTCHTFIIGDK